MYVPDRVVTNEDLAGLMDTSDEWIQQRTGIKERRYVEPGQMPADLAQAACEQALEAAGLEAAEQFPKRSILLKVRSGAISNFWATNSLMRRFA